jgi:hypothetical protein
MAALRGFLRQLQEALVTVAALNWQRFLFPQKPEYTVGWDGSVSIATRYGLDGLGIEARWG